MTARAFSHPRRAGWLKPWFLFGVLMLCGSARSADDASGQTLLKPGSTLSGAWVARGDVFSPAARGAALTGFVQLQQPAALAARAGFLYLADAGRRQIFRFDSGMQSLTPFVAYSAGASANIALAPDLSLYVADPLAGTVSQYAPDGRKIRQFGRDGTLARPVALAINEASGQIAVADSQLRHVAIYSSLGYFVAAHQPDEVRGIEAMAQGPDGLYLLDRVGRQVAVIGWDGDERYAFGAGLLKLPGAIAVDRFNRVFVSDNFDNTIKIFARGQLLDSFSAPPPGFRQITSMTIEQNTLYVADGMSAKVHTFRIKLPAERERSQ